MHMSADEKLKYLGYMANPGEVLQVGSQAEIRMSWEKLKRVVLARRSEG